MENKKNRAVAIWLLTGVVMIMIQTLLGGVTRLTGSGLSITRWNPIFGILPPLNAHQWNEAFDGYKRIGQFKMMNSGYTLADFKFIFFWEWLHRFWARMLGIVFAAGFAFFLVKQYFNRDMIRPFLVLFLLGAMQGLIGWIMVASGLNDSHLYVDHIKLALHFVSAMILACYTLWFALKLLVPDSQIISDRKFFLSTLAVTVLLFVQLTWGAFMAGLKAAMAAPTWPSINGMWWPGTLTTSSLVSEKINVHFIHRGLAYILVLAIVFWALTAAGKARLNPTALLRRSAWWTAGLVVLQATLGVVTVLCATFIKPGVFGPFEILAEVHQMVAMFLLMSLVVNLFAVSGKNV